MAFTFFFRDMHVLELIVDHTLPVLLGRSFPRVWDAGCAMGPEPYSLAILFAERMGQFAFNNLRLHVTDLDECDTFGKIIKDGIYRTAELERIPSDLLEKYFERVDEDGQWRVVDRVRQRIQFQKHDLLSLKPVGESYSLVVCKNVLLHFSAAQRIEVIRMFHGALAAGGFLAMEQTQKLPVELSHLFRRVVSDGQLYQKVED